MNTDTFFATARERYLMLLRRRGDIPLLPGEALTNDTALANWRFCNVFREDDRTTVWFRENLRDPLQEIPRRVIWATIAFRWFNRVETVERIQDLLMLPEDWDPDEVRRRLSDVRPVVSGAYMIRTPKGFNKLDGVIELLNRYNGLFLDNKYVDSLPGTMEGCWERFIELDGVGQFTSHQFVVDLRHTVVLDQAPDVLTWTCPGPGSARGCGWVKEGDPKAFHYTNRAAWPELLGIMKEIREQTEDPNNWPEDWPDWELHDVQHWLCELDRYERARRGKRLKRRYEWEPGQ